MGTVVAVCDNGSAPGGDIPARRKRKRRRSFFSLHHFGVEGYLYRLSDKAFRLYVETGTYLAHWDMLSSPIPRIRSKRIAAQLVEAGLWTLRDGEYRMVRDKRIWTATSTRPRIPDETKLEVFQRDGFACANCGSDQSLSLDHVVPYSLGGNDDPDNLRVLCRSCNSSKGARLA